MYNTDRRGARRGVFVPSDSFGGASSPGHTQPEEGAGRPFDVRPHVCREDLWPQPYRLTAVHPE
jgi:hypothetical protein